VDGPDLGRLLDRSGPLPAARAGAIAETVADALATAHRVGIVHGDVKPSNVLVPRPVGGPAQLTDFSVALLLRIGQTGSPPAAGPASHSPYSAPEVIDGAVPAPSSDVYALGVVVHQMLTGTVPGEPAWRSPGRETDAAFLAAVERCVLPDPAARPPAEAVYHELRDVVARLASASPPGRHGAARRPLPRPESFHETRPAAPHGRDAGWATPAGPRPTGAGRGAPRGARLGLLLAATAAAVMVIAFAVVRLLGGPDTSRTPPGAGGPADTPGPPPVTAPVLPPAATEQTREGGAAFVLYWFAQVAYASQTGDTTALAAATHERCDHCRAMLETIESSYAGGGSLQGGSYVAHRVFTNGMWLPDRPVYDLALDRTARVFVDASGAQHASLPTLSFTNCSVLLEWTGQAWRVRDVPTPDCIG
jgi:hypothetical protein